MEHQGSMSSKSNKKNRTQTTDISIDTNNASQLDVQYSSDDHSIRLGKQMSSIPEEIEENRHQQKFTGKSSQMRGSEGQASNQDSLYPHVDDRNMNDLGTENDSVEIERVQEDRMSGSMVLSETSMYRVADDLNTTFQSEVYRVEIGNRESIVSGGSNLTQTQMLRVRGGTTMNDQSTTSFQQIDESSLQILRDVPNEYDEDEDESDQFGAAIFEKRQNLQQRLTHQVEKSNGINYLSIGKTSNNDSVSRISGFQPIEREISNSMTSNIDFNNVQIVYQGRRDTDQSDQERGSFQYGIADRNKDLSEFQQSIIQSENSDYQIQPRVVNHKRNLDITMQDQDDTSFVQGQRDDRNGSNMIDLNAFQNEDDQDDMSDQDSFIAQKRKAIMINQVD
ncbi:UNKNOWN [Stylonychia lemnae]|uniref:Uncharacterized protein n=1 Tax=Stylonychia lemnae TaxID=5949 RepID=A0A078AT85_STYLE|nr:UNKNOWN [Stylonychia lemnae]|eukprot:CDW85670.1 UNKNOWN [Stylonychia lemnae]